MSNSLGLKRSALFPLHDGPRIAELGAQHAEITDDNEIMVRMLENDTHGTGGDADAAVGAFVLIDNIGTRIRAADGTLGTDLGAFSTLRAYKGSKLARIGKLSLDAEGRLLRVDFMKMLDRADLETKAAARAFVPVDFNPHVSLLKSSSVP